jgi:hypothetical protein
VFAPLASVRVKKLLVAKSKEAVVEAIEEDITFPLNEPVIVNEPVMIAEPVNGKVAAVGA